MIDASPRSWSAMRKVGFGLALLVFIAGCAYPTRNRRATIVDETYGYRWGNLSTDDGGDTVVLVTASGGGTRAAALALSVLRGLDRIVLPDGKTLAQRVDVVSSVSGGSVTAAYFALEGRDGFATLEKDFLRKNGIAALVTSALNPITLAQLATPAKERIDLLNDYLDDQLFHGATYQTLLDSRRKPLLVLNAADMVEGVPFSFTQRKLDLLCSDLSPVPLSLAVSASAAFPVLLTPVTLTNYSPCRATAGKKWPPLWVTTSIDDEQDPFALPRLWYANPDRAALARADYAYALGNDPRRSDPKLYVHLLDGGIADNLGIFEPYRMLTTQDTQPSLLSRISNGQIKKMIFVEVNARSFSESALDQSHATPGTIDMLTASLSAPIDRATAGTAKQLRTLLLAEFREMPGDPEITERFRAFAEDNTALITVDFDAIPEDRCRRRFQSMATSWTLEPEQINGLLEVGQALLTNDPEFERLLQISGGTLTGTGPTLREVCAR